MATVEEKRKLGEQSSLLFQSDALMKLVGVSLFEIGTLLTACAQSYLNTNIMLVRAMEVDEIFAGGDEKFRGGSLTAAPESSSIAKLPRSAASVSQL